MTAPQTVMANFNFTYHTLMARIITANAHTVARQRGSHDGDDHLGKGNGRDRRIQGSGSSLSFVKIITYLYEYYQT